MGYDKHTRIIFSFLLFFLITNIVYSILIVERVIDEKLWWVMITLTIILCLPWITLQCYWNVYKKQRNQTEYGGESHNFQIVL